MKNEIDHLIAMGRELGALEEKLARHEQRLTETRTPEGQRWRQRFVTLYTGKVAAKRAELYAERDRIMARIEQGSQS